MLLLAPPGVYRPQGDTWLLAETIEAVGVRGADVLDVGTGSGALAIGAMRAGARSVTAVDISARAVVTTWLNARLARLQVTVRHADVRFVGGRYDVLLANPPYVPSQVLPVRGRTRAWDAGADGRTVLDPLCSRAGELLRPGGVLLLVQSALSRPERSLTLLRGCGLEADVIARRRQPYGPVLRRRAAWLEQAGVIAHGEREEELVVIHARA